MVMSEFVLDIRDERGSRGSLVGSCQYGSSPGKGHTNIQVVLRSS